MSDLLNRHKKRGNTELTPDFLGDKNPRAVEAKIGKQRFSGIF